MCMRGVPVIAVGYKNICLMITGHHGSNESIHPLHLTSESIHRVGFLKMLLVSLMLRQLSPLHIAVHAILISYCQTQFLVTSRTNAARFLGDNISQWNILPD